MTNDEERLNILENIKCNSAHSLRVTEYTLVDALGIYNETSGLSRESLRPLAWDKLASVISPLMCRDIATPKDPDEFQCSACERGLNIGDQLTGWEPISYCPFCGAKIEEQK